MDDKPDFADSLEAQLIVEYVSEGQTLRAACTLVGVAYSTTFLRINQSERFRGMMEEARKSGYDAIADECLRIADETAFDTIETERGEKPDKEWIARSKLRVETRLKLLAKWHPQRYGEKLQVEQKNATVNIPVSDDPIEAQKAYERLMKGD